jgi:pimeloyl-ACP methyl ester carboxylesterase
MSDAIRPFRIEIPETEVDHLRARLADARWPGELPGVGWTRGFPLDDLKELAEYWRREYDWRAQEARLNQYPQFVTEIDGQRVHFLHVRSERADAKALLITHGFPSSVAEFLRLIEPLVDPEEGQAFHVVAPSLPGYAFSTPLSETGWAMGRTARAWVELMRRLGYERYGVHGGDVGAGVSGSVAGLDGEHVIGCHVVTDPLTAANTATFLPGMADRLDENDPVDKLIMGRMAEFTKDGSGYLAIQNSRPQTIGYGLVDSPLLQLAWIAEKVHEWTDLPVDRDQLLTNVSLYWFTRSGATAAHTLYEQAHSSDWGAPPAVPQGFAVFGADETVRRLVPAPDGAHWTEFERGKHFPAMEAPTELARDLRAFFAPLR